MPTEVIFEVFKSLDFKSLITMGSVNNFFSECVHGFLKQAIENLSENEKEKVVNNIDRLGYKKLKDSTHRMLSRYLLVQNLSFKILSSVDKNFSRGNKKIFRSDIQKEIFLSIESSKHKKRKEELSGIVKKLKDELETETFDKNDMRLILSELTDQVELEKKSCEKSKTAEYLEAEAVVNEELAFYKAILQELKDMSKAIQADDAQSLDG